MNERRLEILKKIEQGELTVEEGFRQIGELEGAGQPAPASSTEQAAFQAGTRAERVEKVEVVSPKPLPDFSNWRIFGWVGFALFLLLTAASASWMGQSWQKHPFGWGFWLAWIPFLIGVAGMALIFNTPWLHIRVRQAPGEKPEKIAISIPFPIGLATWVFHTFGQWMPEKARGVDIGEFLEEVQHGISKDQPLVVEVDDEEDGEHVEIYIG